MSSQMSFPETVYGSLFRNSLVVQTHSFTSCPSDWSQTILQVKKSDVEVLGWSGYTWSAVLRWIGRTAKFSTKTLEAAHGREINIQFSGNSFGGYSCSQHANCSLSQNLHTSRKPFKTASPGEKPLQWHHQFPWHTEIAAIYTFKLENERLCPKSPCRNIKMLKCRPESSEKE